VRAHLNLLVDLPDFRRPSSNGTRESNSGGWARQP
jgi:hypothetical protein